MAGETPITVVGNLVADPELRFTPSGAAVCSFTVASTARRFDKASGEWQDGDPLFLRCNAWRQMAENIAESFRKGNRLIVTGNLVQRSWQDRESGEKRSMLEVQVDDVGASVKFRMVSISEAERSRSAPPPAEDPWGSSAPRGGDWGSAPQRSTFNDEPPF